MKTIKITTKIIKPGLMVTAHWYSTGHWAIRTNFASCKYQQTRYTPDNLDQSLDQILYKALGKDIRAIETTCWLQQDPNNKYDKTFKRLYAEPDGDMTVWVDDTYVAVFKDLYAWSSGGLEPILYTATADKPTSNDDVVAVLMPTRCHLDSCGYKLKKQ